MDNKSKQHSEVEIGLHLHKCEELIGYDFRQKELLKIALTHPSYNHEVSGLHDNQRLEFLGDSVLSIVIAEKLYQDYPEANEGELTRRRSNLICGATLVKIGKSLKLGDFIFMSKSEKRSGGSTRDSTLEDAVEAVIGAIYIDGGWEIVRKTILKWTNELLSDAQMINFEINQKGKLQELVQNVGINIKIQYEITREVGPPHNRFFESEVKIEGKLFGKGSGRTKKEAESIAAEQAIKKFQETEPPLDLK